MPDLINDTPDAKAWVNRIIRSQSTGFFGTLRSAVVWTDALDSNGDPIVDVDPEALVARLAREPLILLHNHDPGRPQGQVLDIAVFTDSNGRRFAAAVLGFYVGGEVLKFKDLGIDPDARVQLARSLPPLPANSWVEIAFDPREVDESWLEGVRHDAQVSIVYRPLSNNSAEFDQELIRVGLAYLTVVWNPFVTAIGSAAGKAVYAAMHAWLRNLFTRMAERRNPILDIHTFHGDCQVSFLLRGKELKLHFAAHDALPMAAVQAASLVDKLEHAGMPARQLVYEFSKDDERWYPSFAILRDGKMVSDSVKLVAIEQLPTGLSLGLSARSSTAKPRNK